MPHARLPKGTRILVAAGATLALLTIGSGAVSAGEITGNGRLKEVHGRSSCAFSGQEDLQWYVDDEDTIPREVVVKGEPKHSQSWGQIDKATRAVLTSMGLNPGIACNPNKSSGEG
jgi:hypothetical protein